jgi:hypothetical protein
MPANPLGVALRNRRAATTPSSGLAPTCGPRRISP